MKLMLNYALIYGSALSEVLAAKLTAFYNKVILQQPTRSIFLLPMDMNISKADLHKAMFDEMSVIKFDPTSASFWNTRILYKILCFTNLASSLEYCNVYIDHGKIFKDVSLSPETDILVARTDENISIVRQMNKELQEHCDMPLLDNSELTSYDFSLCYLSDDVQPVMHKAIKKVVRSYPGYIDTPHCYGILSCLAAHAKRENNVSISCLDQTPIDITHSQLLEDFYTLV